MKFEVGKKYKGLVNPKCIVECFFIMPSGAACCSYISPPEGHSNPDVIVGLSSQECSWEEYHKPEKRWFNKYRDKNGSVKLAGRSFASDDHKSIHGFLTLHGAEQEAQNHPAYWTYLGAVEMTF